MAYTDRDTSAVEMLGVMFQSFATACTNLRIVVGAEAEAILTDLQPMAWYPIARYYRLAELVTASYTDPSPILERIGFDSARVWYESGMGKAVMTRGLDFLTIQPGDGGYRSIIRGPEHVLGAVALTMLDEAAGRARVHSTTLTPRDLERGVLHGGLLVCGDLTYATVENKQDPDVFEIEFH
jgi:hypothetical protein